MCVCVCIYVFYEKKCTVKVCVCLSRGIRSALHYWGQLRRCAVVLSILSLYTCMYVRTVRTVPYHTERNCKRGSAESRVEFIYWTPGRVGVRLQVPVGAFDTRLEPILAFRHMGYIYIYSTNSITSTTGPKRTVPMDTTTTEQATSYRVQIFKCCCCCCVCI